MGYEYRVSALRKSRLKMSSDIPCTSLLFIRIPAVTNSISTQGGNMQWVRDYPNHACQLIKLKADLKTFRAESLSARRVILASPHL